MLSFRPHKLRYKIINEGHFAENGDYIQGSSAWSNEIGCRFVYNTKARQIPFADGTNHVYSFQVYLDNSCRIFKIGEIVRLIDNTNNVVAEMQVQGFSRSQLGSKIWL